MPSLTSVVGAATATFSAALVLAPRLLTGPTGMPDTAQTRALVRALGARDAVIGLAMLAAPRGRLRDLAAAARVLSDCADAAGLPAAVPDRSRAAALRVSAAAWGALALAAAVRDRRAAR
ncbi:hypothetical protein [Geodermatophilus chilensis]|uniref:hypothetical protein n=1 Tax=Geodermatophilus chilensis TaxID=2035835 RepID=UPI000C25740C|nr:hypothetical protein [Geodermatophilus chilensis]